MRRNILATAVALSLALPAYSVAQDDTEATRSELEELRQQIQVLEDRLDEQDESEAAKTAEREPARLAVPEQDSARPLPSNNAFNPAISLIVDGRYRHLEQDPDTWEIGGFVPAGGHGHDDDGGHGHGSGPGERGFSLNESELAISANIDPYWAGFFTAGVRNEEFDVEEAWIQNSGFIPGLVAKAGRFFSGVGYVNQQHPHVWDFGDLPLVNQAFYGGNLAEDGVQVRYVAPTPLFLEFGGEIGRGNAFPGSERNENGPNAWSAFAHLGGDVGFSNSYQVGGSYRDTKAYDREYDDEDSMGNGVENEFTDLDSITWGLDFIWKWAPNGDISRRYAKIQGEYYWREEDGQMGYDLDDMTGMFAQEGAYNSKQSGWYLQGIYQFIPRWRVGLRYDLLDSGTITYEPVTNGSLAPEDLQHLLPHEPERTTVMVDFSPSEFSRFRLQYAQDKVRRDVTDDQLMFQFIVSLGSHGAHRF